MVTKRAAGIAATTMRRAAATPVKRKPSRSPTSDQASGKRSRNRAPRRPATRHIDTQFSNDFKNEDDQDSDVRGGEDEARDDASRDKKWKTWSANATSTPFPDFGHPTSQECRLAYNLLYKLHNDAVEAEFEDENTPETIPFVLDALIVAVLSQATSWSNAKRAMNGMKGKYGSVFAYDKIYSGGPETLQETLRCGGLHVRKTKIILSILEEVKRRHGCWNLDHLLEASDEDAMKELMSYKYIGPKSAFVVLGWCLKRNRFTVDTHVYRIAGLWGWRPKEASREKTQSHLDAVIPADLKFKLHFFLIQHGRTCPACRGGSKTKQPCAVLTEVREHLNE
ncbi:hypothetical protein NW752_007616 [Fusarium irregulare]|uniref:HhH-GPD domain-containing protein n=1 Tax=Fusarium irregulare TaxID=2494466 RepID=A0A9W8PI95_9HYPO|nr:hypothetical protein NW766_010089 [Fusarium irregulare]KAJ4013319.1 hypothetical protein NW752_007616 [Fusarium irregulare]